MVWIIFIAALVGLVFISYLKKIERSSFSNIDSKKSTTNDYRSNSQLSDYTSNTYTHIPTPSTAKKVNFAVKGTSYRSQANINAAKNFCNTAFFIRTLLIS